MQVESELPGWRRLWDHSVKLGWRWVASGRWSAWRVGLARLLVPLDPWRYYELGKAAELDYSGKALDVSSPKLLPSLLHCEGRGAWLGIDIFEEEIASWRRVDPRLPLDVLDATNLPYDDGTYDHCLSISVVEHIAGDGDRLALSEMFRILKPGGTLTLTTNVRSTPEELWRDDAVWGPGSAIVDGRVFYERHYSPDQLESRLLGEPWERLHVEYAMERDRSIHDAFEAGMPWSVATGRSFRHRCPGNFEVAGTPEILASDRHGVVFLRLRKPGGAP